MNTLLALLPASTSLIGCTDDDDDDDIGLKGPDDGRSPELGNAS